MITIRLPQNNTAKNRRIAIKFGFGNYPAVTLRFTAKSLPTNGRQSFAEGLRCRRADNRESRKP
jgi:hypothetical protein